jgi:hypothetical protein
VAHVIQTLIVREPDARAICDAIPGARRTQAGMGYWLVPLTSPFDEVAPILRQLDLEEASPGEVASALQGLVASLGNVVREAAIVVAVTEYFGGEGSQASAVIQQGKLVDGPFMGHDAINRALRLVGVERGDFADEFSALELHRWRRNDDVAKDGE